MFLGVGIKEGMSCSQASKSVIAAPPRQRLEQSSCTSTGRVDMLTSPVAAARAAVATGTWVKSKHDMYLMRGSVGA